MIEVYRTVKTQLYKILKGKRYLVILVIFFFPLLFDWILYVNPSLFVDVESLGGKGVSYYVILLEIWVILYTNFIYQLLAVYLVSAVCDEDKSGQVVYELTRIHSRTALVVGKFLSLVVFLVICFISYVISSFLGYFLLVRHSSVYVENNLQDPTQQEWIQFAFVSLLIVFVTCFIYALSSLIHPIASFIIILVFHFVFLTTSGVESWKYIPGSLAYKNDYGLSDINIWGIASYQAGVIVVLLLVCLFVKIHAMRKKEVTW